MQNDWKWLHWGLDISSENSGRQSYEKSYGKVGVSGFEGNLGQSTRETVFDMLQSS